MKKLLTLISVFALAAIPAASQAVTLTLTDNGSGSVTVGYTGASEDISGVSVLVTLSGGDAVLASPTDASGAGDFNAHIDHWSANGGPVVLPNGNPVGHATQAGLPGAGATSFAISTGVLKDPAGGSAAASGDIATLQLTGTTSTTIALSADTAGRGGIVGVSGASLTVDYSATVEVFAGGCSTCPGDLTGDGFITGPDIQLLIPAFGSAAADANFEACGDINGDGFITGPDIQLLIPLFGTACP